MARYDLTHYDGVLAFGCVIRDLYLQNGWTRRAWTWHEAADTRVFHPQPVRGRDGDLVWIGNWGDDERTQELHEFLLEPVKTLGLKAKIYGVRYPESALRALADAGIEYGGWLPNFRVPEIFARYRMTVHVPRRPYVEALPGVPTIRVFEALACAIPLISAPWDDAEHLFAGHEDYTIVPDGAAMREHLARAMARPEEVNSLARCGFEAVRGATPALIAWMSCSKSIVRWSRSNGSEYRFLRLEPHFGLLEWGRDVLSRHHPRAP